MWYAIGVIVVVAGLLATGMFLEWKLRWFFDFMEFLGKNKD
jgi:hypothetical protein